MQFLCEVIIRVSNRIQRVSLRSGTSTHIAVETSSKPSYNNAGIQGWNLL